MMVPLPHKMGPVVGHYPVTTIKIHRVRGLCFRWAVWLSHTISVMLVLYVSVTRLLMRVVAMRASMRMRPAGFVCFGDIKLCCQ